MTTLNRRFDLRTRLAIPAVAALLVVAVQAPAVAADLPADPLNSPMWTEMGAQFFAGAKVVHAPSIKVVVPSIVEDQAQVPVTVDARAIPGVTRLVVFADLNPIQHVLTLTPRKAVPFVSFRMKVEQGTPVRAAALTADGTWHVGSVYLDAAGGGCSAPAMARKDADWSETVGIAQGKSWRQPDGTSRVRFRVRHPMDTGLSRNNIPAYFIEKLELTAGKGDGLATLELREPVSENPTVTLLLNVPSGESAVKVEGRDNNGSTYRSSIPSSFDQSALDPAPTVSR